MDLLGDQSLVLAAGATAGVVVVTGLIVYCGAEPDKDENAEVDNVENKNDNSNSSSSSSSKKKSKKKKAKKASSSDDEEVKEEVVKQAPAVVTPPVAPVEEFVEVSKKKGKKGKKDKASKPKVVSPEPEPEPEPEPVPEPEPEVVAEPEPVVVKSTKSKKDKKDKKSKAAAAEPTPAPEPEPNPVVKEETPAPPVAIEKVEAPPVEQTSNKKSNKKNKKNKQAASSESVAAAAPVVSSAKEAEAEEPEEVWTTVAKKRPTKSQSGGSHEVNTSASSNQDAAGGFDSMQMLDVSILEKAMQEGTNLNMEGGGDRSSPDLQNVNSCTIDLGIFVAAVIGRGGETIKAITEKSGAKLKVGGKDSGEENSSLCVITGDEDAVSIAEELIREILDREQAIKDKNIELNIDVGDKMPAVIGKKGLIIKKIVSESGATIDRLPDENVLVIRGFVEQVTAAKALIELYMAGGPPPEAREEVELGSERGRFVVLGPKGQTIRNIQEETGAKLSLEHDKTFVTVEGEQDAVDAAVVALRTLLDENSCCEKVSTRGVNSNKSHIPAIIGKQGAVIKKLRETSGAAIDLLSAEDCVKISGTKEQVRKAKAAINKILTEEDTPAYDKLKTGEVCQDVSVPVSAIGLVIGRMGLTIKQIKDESGAEILVPKGKSDEVPGVDGKEATTTAKVWGTIAAVEKAMTSIKEILKRHEERAKNDKKRNEGGVANSSNASSNGVAKKSHHGNENITFFGVDVDDDVPEISFEVGMDNEANEWDAAGSAPPGIAPAPGWS